MSEKVGVWLWLVYWSFVVALLACLGYLVYAIWREAT